jgi:hypothetical protein
MVVWALDSVGVLDAAWEPGPKSRALRNSVLVAIMVAIIVKAVVPRVCRWQNWSSVPKVGQSDARPRPTTGPPAHARGQRERQRGRAARRTRR